jgi:hypothetical protein
MLSSALVCVWVDYVRGSRCLLLLLWLLVLRVFPIFYSCFAKNVTTSEVTGSP